MIDAQNNEIVQWKRHPRVAGAARGHILQMAILALFAAGTVHLVPVWGILSTGAFWLTFSIYWGLA